MTPAQIRKRKENLFVKIQWANKELEELRKICPHENQSPGIWSWRIGAQDEAIICDDCGECVTLINKPISGTIVSATHFWDGAEWKPKGAAV